MSDTLRIPPARLLAETRWLRGLAASLAGPDDADDLAQTAWLAALEQRPGRVRGLRPWLRAVIRNAAARRWRADSARVAREMTVARAATAPPAADLVARASVHRAVVDAVLTLDEPARATVLLRFFESLPPREIARLQGVPVATVRTRLRRALEVLRTRLDRDFGTRGGWVSLVAPLLSKPVVPAAAVKAASAAAIGALLMSVKTKALLLAAAAVLLSIATWVAWDAASPRAPENASQVADARPAPSPAAVPESAARSDTRGAEPVRTKPFVEADDVAVDYPITGRVIAAATGEPVAGATVTCFDAVPGREPVARAVATDRDGRFRLPIWRPKFQFELDVFRDDFARREMLVHAEGKDIGEREGWDLGDVKLERGAPLDGRVVTESGAPVGGAAILALRQGKPQYGFHHLEDARQLATSAADGSFRLSERMACQDGERFLLAVSEDALGWGWFAVAPGADTVDPATIVVGRGHQVRVRVEDDAKVAVAGATVMAYPRFQPLGSPRYPGEQIFFWPSPGLDARLRAHFYATTGADGIAVFPGLPLGSHADDRRFHWGHHALDDYDFLVSSESRDPGSASCRIQGEHPDPVVITVRGPRTITLSGRVRDLEGKPIAGATVGVFHLTLQATTDAAGRYEITGIRSEWRQFLIGASAPGYGRRSVPYVPPETGDAVNCDFVLLRALPVQGRVVDESGAKVTGWYVHLLKPGDRMATARTVQDGTSGTFEFADVSEGEWMLAFGNPDTGKWEIPAPVTVRAGDVDVEVVVRRLPDDCATVVATVVDAVTGNPADVADARLELQRAVFSGGGNVVPEQKLEKGRVTFTNVIAGSWQLALRTTDGRAVARIVDVSAKDRLVDVRVEVAKAGAILGRLVLDAVPEDRRPASITVLLHAQGEGLPTTPDGKPVEGASRGYAQASRADGWRFRFADVTPGRRATIFIYDERLFGHAEVEVKPDQDVTVDVRCVESATVVRSVKDASPDARLVFFLRRPDGPPVRLDWETDTSPHELQVPAGPFAWRAELYEVKAGAAGRTMRAAEGELRLAPGAKQDLEIVFP